MKQMSKYFKPSVVALKPYTSARDEYDGKEGVFLDANENAFINNYNRYPDPYQQKLKQAIGQWRKVDPKSIFIGNGSDEIIDLLIRSTCTAGKDRILSLDPSYGMYRVSSAINEIPLDLLALNPDFTIDEEALKDGISDAHKLIFICSPNNPNGNSIDVGIIEKVLERAKGLVLIDEAYIDFSNSTSWLSKLPAYENLIVLQTFSKSLGGAGLRIGMAFMHPELISFLNKIKPPYNISTPNQEAALRKLKNLESINATIQRTIEQREALRESLSSLSMVESIFPSEANFLLVKFYNAPFVFEQLKAKKIIVRDRSREKNCEGCLRITVGTMEENDTLLNALNQITQQKTIAI